MRPRILDLFCGAGGSAMGYHRAGFEVVGVDIARQPNYPFTFFWMDAFDAMCGDVGSIDLSRFDAIHASPPCQAYSNAQRIQDRDHPDLVAKTRKLLQETGLPYVIENVPGAPLEDPIQLCGSSFGLRTYRHRLFETNFFVEPIPHCDHMWPQVKMGRPAQPNEFIQIVGNFSGAEEGRWAMGINWMTRDELKEAVPPAFTGYIGAYLRDHLAWLEMAA